MTAASTSSMPMPVLPLTRITSAGSMTNGGFHLADDEIGPGVRQVDLVERRDDLEVGVHREEGVGDGLRLHALEGVDEQDRSFARGQAARDLVVEIDVAGRVDQVQFVLDAVELVVDRDRVHADGDAALAFEVHAVERLGLDVALGDRAGLEQELIGQRALAVIDVRDDAEVADVRGRRRHVGTALQPLKATLGS